MTHHYCGLLGTGKQACSCLTSVHRQAAYRSHQKRYYRVGTPAGKHCWKAGMEVLSFRSSLPLLLIACQDSTSNALARLLQSADVGGLCCSVKQCSACRVSFGLLMICYCCVADADNLGDWLMTACSSAHCMSVALETRCQQMMVTNPASYWLALMDCPGYRMLVCSLV